MNVQTKQLESVGKRGPLQSPPPQKFWKYEAQLPAAPQRPGEILAWFRLLCGGGGWDSRRRAGSGPTREYSGSEVRERVKSWVVDMQGAMQTALLLLALSPSTDILLQSGTAGNENVEWFGWRFQAVWFRRSSNPCLSVDESDYTGTWTTYILFWVSFVYRVLLENIQVNWPSSWLDFRLRRDRCVEICC